MMPGGKILKESYDVIVIGAGPAGSCAAWRSALKGCSVLLLEKDPEIGVPVRCAEAIATHEVSAFLGEPPPEMISANIRGARLTSPAGKTVTLIEKMAGYILDRTVFDKALAEQANTAGADVLTGTPATGMERKADGWEVTVDYNGAGQKVFARGVVGADGVESRVGRWAGLKTITSMKHMESCYQYRLAGLDIDQQLIELAFGSRISPGGYAWVFPKGDGTANVGLGIIRHATKERLTAKDFLDRWIENRFPEATSLGEVAGGVPVSSTLPVISSEYLLLAGDSAHQVDPMSGAGISSGMRAGWLAGGILAEQIAHGDLSARALRRYDNEWSRILGRLHRNHYRLGEMIFKTTDDQFNKLAEDLNSLPPKKRTLPAAFSRAVRNHPTLMLILAGYLKNWWLSDKERGFPPKPPAVPNVLNNNTDSDIIKKEDII